MSEGKFMRTGIIASTLVAAVALSASGYDDEADLTGSSDPNDSSYGRPDGDVDADDFVFFLNILSQECRV